MVLAVWSAGFHACMGDNVHANEYAEDGMDGGCGTIAIDDAQCTIRARCIVLAQCIICGCTAKGKAANSDFDEG